MRYNTRYKLSINALSNVLNSVMDTSPYISWNQLNYLKCYFQQTIDVVYASGEIN